LICSLFWLLKIWIISSNSFSWIMFTWDYGLFYIINIYYIRSYSRLIIVNKGYINYISAIVIWWFLFCSANFSFPFSLNFIGEIIMIIVLLGWKIELIISIGLICFFLVWLSHYICIQLLVMRRFILYLKMYIILIMCPENECFNITFLYRNVIYKTLKEKLETTNYITRAFILIINKGINFI